MRTDRVRSASCERALEPATSPSVGYTCHGRGDGDPADDLDPTAPLSSQRLNRASGARPTVGCRNGCWSPSDAISCRRPAVRAGQELGRANCIHGRVVDENRCVVSRLRSGSNFLAQRAAQHGDKTSERIQRLLTVDVACWNVELDPVLTKDVAIDRQASDADRDKDTCVTRPPESDRSIRSWVLRVPVARSAVGLRDGKPVRRS
jgi:hypothetical protein